MEQSVSELTNLLQRWEDKITTPNYNPIPTLIKLCELFEAELKKYLNKDTDYFVECHPFRIDHTCVLGQMYKILFLKDSLINKLVMDYSIRHHWPKQTKENHNLNVVACRLILNLIPGLETTVFFKSPENDQFIQRLFTWAENTNEPLQTYATGLLASCMELTYIAANFKEDNNKLVPIILDRLHSYYTQFCKEHEINQSTQPYQNANCEQVNDISAPSSKKIKREENGICGDRNSSSTKINACWLQIDQPTLTTKLVYCLKYLVPTGQYQEFLSHAYEKNALNLVMKIINSSEKQNSYLTSRALKYLAALLCHKKFATEFIDSQQLQKLLLIPKHNILSNGVSICFNSLSYCEEAMERICLLPKHVLVDLVKYALWMFECFNDYSSHAIMFFSYSFHFKIILEIFDNNDGLCKLFNVVSTLPILSSEDPAYSSLTEDTERSAKQIIHHVCAGFKNYFEAHLHIKAQQIRRAKMRDSDPFISSTMVDSFISEPGCKATKKSRSEVQEEIELLSNDVSLKNHWTPIDQLLKLGGLSLLFKIISLTQELNFSGRHNYEIIKNALEVLNICAVLPKVQLALCEIPSPNVPADNQNDTSTLEEDNPQAENGNVVLNIIIRAAAGDFLDADIQKAALSVIITCVCAPIHRESGSIAYYSSHEPNKKQTPKTYDDAVVEKVWDCFRNHNGIMVLLTLLAIKTPISDVDAIRGLASRALAGLARSESVCQIMSKLILFNSGQIQSLMKHPLLQEKHQEHVTFQKYASELIELVSGSKKSNGAEIGESLEDINRANIVAHTKINFDEQQFLLLMYQHLMAKGQSKTAESLVQEANLNIAETKSTPFTYIFHCRNRSIVGEGLSPKSSRYTIQNQKSGIANSSNGSLDAKFRTRGISSTPIRLNVNRRSENHPKPEPEPELESPLSKLVHKKTYQDLTLLTDSNTNLKVSLESIVTEYFTNQHASCKHPMVTCPQFNFFVPHKCPDPKPRRSICKNFAMRFSKNIHSRKLNQKLIHSRFCQTRQIQMDDVNAYFTCCEFLSQNRVAIGTSNGGIKVFNLLTSQEEPSFVAHSSYIMDLQCNNDKRLLLSSASWGMPSVSVWSISEDAINIKYSFIYEEYCTFSNYDQNKILGTNGGIATIYDLETRNKILTLVPTYSNLYSRNRAVFNATNELVLSDGVLWDAIAGKEIHKFDKLNECVSGIFHPNELEIISNKEVWDMRTFQLLRTVPSLDQCNVTFSKSGEGMYLYVVKHEIENGSSYQTTFKTLDPNDYSNIATVDVKKCIYHMACNSYDTQIAIVENQEIFENIDESIVRIYDVGRSRNEDEAFEEMLAGVMNDNVSNSSNCSFESVGDSSRQFTALSDSSKIQDVDA